MQEAIVIAIAGFGRLETLEAQLENTGFFAPGCARCVVRTGIAARDRISGWQRPTRGPVSDWTVCRG